MIRYEVRLDVPPPMAGAIEQYMRVTHIPEIMATGCFVRARFDRAESGAYRTTYVAASQEAFERFMTEHFARFRGEFLRQFPSGVVPARELWTAEQEWT